MTDQGIQMISRLLFVLGRVADGDHRALENAPRVVEEVTAECKAAAELAGLDFPQGIGE